MKLIDSLVNIADQIVKYERRKEEKMRFVDEKRKEEERRFDRQSM